MRTLRLMSRRRISQRLVSCAVAIVLAGSAAACGSDDEISDEELFGPTTTSDATSGPVIEGLFDAGGHRLYLKCSGSGSPTVVFLHGSVRSEGDAGHESAGPIPSQLDERHRFCVYDRANVGRSESVSGRLTGSDSARDLHTLLRSAKVPGPYVLLGQSLGGAISDLYAAAYPAEVAGMVLLDSTVPAYLDMYKRLYPPGSGPQPGEWRHEAERLDRLATFREAGKIQSRKAKIPVTYIAAKLVVEPKIATVIRRAQQAFVRRFSPGRRIEVDAPHNMVPVVPQIIVREVERVIAATKQR